MTSLCSVALSDEDLLRFVMDGEDLPPIAMEHLERCITCQKRLKHYRDVNTFYLSHFYRSQCPDTLKLSYYCADILPLKEKMRVEYHLSVCPLCVSECKDIQSCFSPGELADISARCDGDKKSESVMYYRFDEMTLTLRFSYDDNSHAVIDGMLSSCGYTQETLKLCQGMKVELYQKPVNPNKLCEPASEKDNILPCYETCPFLTTVINYHGVLKFCHLPPGEYFMIIYLPETALVIEELCIGTYSASSSPD